MMHFLQSCLKPDAVLMLFIAAVCLVGYGVPGWQERQSRGYFWLLFLFIGVLAAIAWLFLVAS